MVIWMPMIVDGHDMVIYETTLVPLALPLESK